MVGFEKAFHMYSVVFDTNCLQQGVGKDFSRPWIIKSLESYCQIIEAMDAHEHFKFLIPEIVLQELRKHQLEQHKDSIEKAKRLKLPSWSFEYDGKGYKHLLDGELEKLRLKQMLGSTPLEVLPLPEANCLERLVCRVIDKKPPFCGGKSESDKGFKDALIWESLLEYKRINPKDIITLVTADKLLGSDELQEEYKKEFDEELIVIKSLTALSERIKTLISEMKLGFAAPDFVAENDEITSVVKSWLLENSEWFMEKCNASYHTNGRMRISVDSIESSDEGIFHVGAALRFECDTDEVAVDTVELTIEKREDGEWWLCSIEINDVKWRCNEPLGGWWGGAR